MSRAPDRRASTFGGTLAVLVAVAVGLALGVATDSLPATVACLAGATLAALGVRAAQSEANDRRAAGSVGVVAGAAALSGVALLDAGLVPLLAGVAVAAAATNAVVSLDDRVERPALRTAWRSATVLAVGAVAAAGLYAGAFAGLARFTVDGLAAAAGANDLFRLVALQVEVLALAELFRQAVPILDLWLPADRDVRAAAAERFDLRVEELPRAYWAFFCLQVVLALTAWGPRWFDAFLGSLSTFGAGIRLLLRSGVLHVPLAAVLVALVAVFVGRAGQLAAVAWAGSDPPGALARSTGGFAALVAGIALALSPAADYVADAGGADWAVAIESFGATATVAGGLAVVLFALVAAERVVGDAVRPWVVSDASGGFAVAGAGLFVAALVAARADPSAFAVFAGVAGALAVHDLGSNAVDLGAQVGAAGETRAGEAAHAVGTLAVGAVGVGLATLTAFLMNARPASVPAWRARLAVALSLVAVLCFAVLVVREE